MQIFFLFLFLCVQIYSKSTTSFILEKCTNFENKNITGTLYCIPPSSKASYDYIDYDINLTSKYSILDNDNPLDPFKMDKRYEKIFMELAYLQVFAVATIGVLTLLPTSFTHWDKKDKNKNFLQIHSDNINEGPVKDSDHWTVNYIGHPVAGSYYYIWGRQEGLSRQESFVLTALMSTVYWEYGWEAFAERPSIQDLIVTPLLGSLLGEGTSHLYNEIHANNNTLYGSKILASLAKALLNPIGELNTYFNHLLDNKNIKISVDYSFKQKNNHFSSQPYSDNNDYLQNTSVGIKFNFNY